MDIQQMKKHYLRNLLNLGKNWESPWYKNQDPHLTFYLSLLIEVEIPLGTGTAKNTGLPPTWAPSQRVIFLERAGPQHFSFCLKLPLIEAKFQATVAEK